MTTWMLTLTLFLGGMMIALIGFPLALGRVRRNSIYGFRTSKTLSSDRAWYLGNRHSGRGMIVAGGIAMLAALPFGLVAPWLPGTTAAWLMGLLLIGPLLFSLYSTLKYLRRF
ncbi:MAG TPA: SdpI family protein [Fimbriimonadaceae bacterium]|nr:SdpI family protein [Fimbriimonadaceae bacterium]